MTTPNNAADPFEYWREMFQKSTEAWAQAVAGSPGNAFWPPFFGAAPGATMPGFNGAQASNPFAQFASPFFNNDIQQMWQQFYNTWAEQSRKAMESEATGAEAFVNAQKRWSEQLEVHGQDLCRGHGDGVLRQYAGQVHGADTGLAAADGQCNRTPAGRHAQGDEHAV